MGFLDQGNDNEQFVLYITFLAYIRNAIQVLFYKSET
jgi:hypothetical protein